MLAVSKLTFSNLTVYPLFFITSSKASKSSGSEIWGISTLGISNDPAQASGSLQKSSVSLCLALVLFSILASTRFLKLVVVVGGKLYSVAVEGILVSVYVVRSDNLLLSSFILAGYCVLAKSKLKSVVALVVSSGKLYLGVVGDRLVSVYFVRSDDKLGVSVLSKLDFGVDCPKEVVSLSKYKGV